MPFIKKLVIAPLFLVLIAILSIQVDPILKDYSLIFSLSEKTILQFGGLVLLIMLTSFTFIVFGSLAQDFKISGSVLLIGALMPLFLINSNYSYIISLGFLLGFSLVGIVLTNKLKSYLSFQPTTLFSSPIKNLTGILIVVISLTYYFSIGEVIKTNGFEIPDSLIESMLPLINSSLNSNQLIKGERYLAQTPQLTPENIEFLKKNPELLKQYNIDPKILDSLPSAKSAPSTTGSKGVAVPLTSLITKDLIKNQLNSLIKPFESFIGLILATLFFSLLMSFNWVISFLVAPLLYLTFLALEKSGFVHFEKEMREVKRMVV